jgi:hypothetical protein
LGGAGSLRRVDDIPLTLLSNRYRKQDFRRKLHASVFPKRKRKLKLTPRVDRTPGPMSPRGVGTSTDTALSMNVPSNANNRTHRAANSTEDDAEYVSVKGQTIHNTKWEQPQSGESGGMMSVSIMSHADQTIDESVVGANLSLSRQSNASIDSLSQSGGGQVWSSYSGNQEEVIRQDAGGASSNRTDSVMVGVHHSMFRPSSVSTLRTISKGKRPMNQPHAVVNSNAQDLSQEPNTLAATPFQTSAENRGGDGGEGQVAPSMAYDRLNQLNSDGGVHMHRSSLVLRPRGAAPGAGAALPAATMLKRPPKYSRVPDFDASGHPFEAGSSDGRVTLRRSANFEEQKWATTASPPPQRNPSVAAFSANLPHFQVHKFRNSAKPAEGTPPPPGISFPPNRLMRSVRQATNWEQASIIADEDDIFSTNLGIRKLSSLLEFPSDGGLHEAFDQSRRSFTSLNQSQRSLRSLNQSQRSIGGSGARLVSGQVGREQQRQQSEI